MNRMVRLNDLDEKYQGHGYMATNRLISFENV
jgi:hypothetical protein